MTQAPHPWQDPETKEINVDYCIVGGGISGLYSAVRLAQTHGGQEPPRICILEATHRVGGRIVTVDIPGSSHYADFGAMRFIPTQPLIGSIVEHYGLETYDYDFPTDFYFVRGHRVDPRNKDADSESSRQQLLVQVPETSPQSEIKDLYHSLRPQEKDKEPGALVIHAIARALQKVVVAEPVRGIHETLKSLADVKALQAKLSNKGCYDNVMTNGFKAFTPKEWKTIKLLGRYPTHLGLCLYQLGFWDVVQSQLSSEAYSCVDEGLGYQTIIGTWNAADAIPWFLADFSNLPYKSIKGGMGEIPHQLHLSFLESMARRRDLSPFDPDLVLFQRTRVQKIWWQEADGRVGIDAYRGLTSKYRVKASHCLVCVSKGAIERIQFVTDPDSNDNELKHRSVLISDFRSPKPSMEGAPAPLSERTDMIGRIVNEYPEDPRVYTFDWLLKCVEPQPLLKMFLSFKIAWWEKAWQHAEEYREKPPRGFKILTNLPLRQIYYHSSRGRSPVTDPAGKDSSGVIMAYCDAKHATYWDALAFQEKRRYAAGDLEAAMNRREQVDGALGSGRPLELESLEEFGVSRHFAERAHEQIWRVHKGLVKSEDLPPEMREASDFSLDEDGNQEEIARSETVMFMNWMNPPFYGGWHAWRIGVVSDDVKTIWERPWMGANIYFAGEIMSSDQGWCEGALRSAERVLMRQLGVPAPEWEKRGVTREDLAKVDVSKRARDLGFDGISEYIEW